jgi:DNA-binding LacI/PurR family transcriptional regulator
MPKSGKMADIAEGLGVSTVTDSKGLAGKDGVSEEIRVKIKALAREMGYHYGPPANPTKKTGNIGILIPERFVEKGRSFYWEIYQRLIGHLSENGYYGILEMLKRNDERQLNEPHVLQDKKIDGIIMIGQELPEYKKMLRKSSDVPVIFLDSYDVFNGNDCVISNGYYGMCAVTNHLIELGHRDIRFVGTLNFTSSINDRYSGYHRAMLEHGLTVTPDMVIPDRSADGDISVALPDTLPTAFACNCDLAACNVINMLKERGCRVPEDVSVTGFDDYVFPGFGYNEITTYSVDTDAMVQACINQLIKKIHNPNYISNLKIVPGHFIVRGTTSAVPLK